MMGPLLKSGSHPQAAFTALATVSSLLQQQASAWDPSLSLIPTAHCSSSSAPQVRAASSPSSSDNNTVATSGFILHKRRATRSGYRESALATSQADAQVERQNETPDSLQGTLQVLKIPLAKDESHKDKSDNSLSSSQQQPQLQSQQHTATPEEVARHRHAQEVQAVLSKLVGSLTKEGKKHVAQAIVRDTLRIMQERLAAGEVKSTAAS